MRKCSHLAGVHILRKGGAVGAERTASDTVPNHRGAFQWRVGLMAPESRNQIPLE